MNKFNQSGPTTKLIIVFLLILNIDYGKSQTIFTSDIENFWTAVDIVHTTSDTLEQLNHIQKLYIDKGTNGLKAFMELRNFDAQSLVKAINSYPLFWESIRPATLEIHKKEYTIHKYIQKFKSLYPASRVSDIYFTISAIRSGGTTQGNRVLIGSEIAVGNVNTEVSEFADNRLKLFFKNQVNDNIIPFTIHEYVHTQQIETETGLLGQCIYEGACEFITELVLDTTLDHTYLKYGRKHEEELKKQFLKEMFSDNYKNWLYNGSNPNIIGDLGYFIGYAICKSYYERSFDKKSAVKEIIELDYSDDLAVSDFLNRSGYFD